MKVLSFLFVTVLALPSVSALPTVEEARSLLGSTNAKERATATQEIWQNGKASLPLLRELAKDRTPEVANRAGFILRRLRMGLMPASPPDLLGLAETLEHATPDQRTKQLIKLLDHPEGVPVALTLFEQWASQKLDQPALLLEHAHLVTEAILESRSYWKRFFTTELSPECRAAILAEMAQQDLPMRSQIITILAKYETSLVYDRLKELTETVSPQIIQSLARTALVAGDLPLALRVLGENLATAPDPDLARALAYLEAASGTPPIHYEGPWALELQLFRARLRGDIKEVKVLASRLKNKAFLQYESLLLTGELALPAQIDSDLSLPSKVALRALHTSFGASPGEPDIEALSAEILIDWTVLARTLTLLGSPLEAAETLTLNGQATSAVGLLWRTHHRAEALALAQQSLSSFDTKEEAKMRLTLTSLYLEAGDLEAAKKVFEPLLYLSEMRKDYQRKAVGLGLQLYPREALLPLTPKINSKQAYQRAPAISLYLRYPEKVAVTFYEHFLAQDPLQSPSTLFKKIETFLDGDQAEARELVTQKLAVSSKKRLLPSDALYQSALFLQLPGALEMVSQAAWYQLSIQDLLGILQNESWPAETREEALATALLIDPTNPILRWHDRGNKDALDLETLHHLTLGDAGQALKLGALTGKRESLKLAAQIVDFRDFQALRVLTVLAKSHLANAKSAKPAEAARLYQAALCGEVAAGNQIATSIPITLGHLTSYLQSRAATAKDEGEKAVWQSRIKSLTAPQD